MILELSIYEAMLQTPRSCVIELEACIPVV